MKMIYPALLALAAITTTAAASDGISSPVSTVRGDYLEARTCDVYTGSCVANSEMGLSGKEGILVWSIRDGAWNGVRLDGLNVVAVIRANGTLGDIRYEPRSADAVVLVDSKASPRQHQALLSFVKAKTAGLVQKIVEIQSAPIEAAIGTCTKASGCAFVKAGANVEISTRCMGSKDHLCGNEELYYPPLTEVTGTRPAFAEIAAFNGTQLNVQWQTVGRRSVYLATFGQ